MEDAPHEATVSYEEADFREMHALTQRAWGAAVAAFGALMLGLYLWGNMRGGETLAAAATSPFFLVVAAAVAAGVAWQAFVYPRRLAREAFAAHGRAPVRFRFTRRHLEADLPSGHARFAWPTILGARETPRLLLLRVDRHHVVLLPKRALAGGTLAYVRSRLAAPPAAYGEPAGPEDHVLPPDDAPPAPVAPGHVRVEVRPQEDDFLAWHRLQAGRARWVPAASAVVLAGLLAWVSWRFPRAFASLMRDPAFLAILALLALTLAWTQALLPRRYAREAAATYAGRPATLVLGPDGVEVASPEGRVARRWDDLHAVREGPTIWALMVSAHQPIVVPKRDLTPEATALLRQAASRGR